MKLSSKTIILLTVVGLALLVAGGLYFSSPLFGQVILGIIIVIFVGAQYRYFKNLGQLEHEEELLPKYREQEKPTPLDKGIIAHRIEVAARLAARKVYPDPEAFSDILSASEGNLVSRSPGGLVVTLGLLGTFYGLMVAVSTAGYTLDSASNAQTTLASVRLIFSSMQGIFGTSLAGLVAAIMLNATHALLTSRQTKLEAEIEEYTQFQLLPAFAPASDPAERQMQLMVEKLGQVTLALQQGIQERNEQSVQLLREQVERSTQSLQDGLRSEIRSLAGELSQLTGGYAKELSSSGKALQGDLQASLSEFRSGFSALQQQVADSLSATVRDTAAQVANQQQAALQGMQSAVSSLSTDLSAMQKVAAEGLRDSVAALSDNYQAQWQQMASAASERQSQADTQWSAFMDSLRQSAQESLVHQKEGLATLRDVAEQVAVKALDESANLSSTFAAQIEKLSSEVQSSFGQLAVASRELVEAQGRLLGEMESRIAQEKEAAAGFSGDLGEAATLMRINQSEFQASLEMFRLGVEHILEKFTGNSAEQESQRNFIEQLHASLEAFHEKASEVLVENAMRTQEILLEILEQSRPASEGKADA